MQPLNKKDMWDTYFITCSEWNFMIQKHFHLVFKNSHSQIIFKIVVLKHFATFTRKPLCLSYVLIKLQPWRTTILWKRDSNADVLLEYGKIFKSNYFEENLRATVPEQLGKISSLLVLGKPLLDGKRHNWAILKIWTS